MIDKEYIQKAIACSPLLGPPGGDELKKICESWLELEAERDYWKGAYDREATDRKNQLYYMHMEHAEALKEVERLRARLKVLAEKAETAWREWLDSDMRFPTEDFLESLGALLESMLGRPVNVGGE